MTPPLALPASRVPDPRDAPVQRWGILAPGGIAGAFVRSLFRHTRQQVVACGSRSGDRAEAFAAEHGIPRAHASYADLVSDPDVDVVYVASPHSHHREHALLAIAAGKPVLVEKAFTRNAVEAREVVAAARAAGVTVMEAMWTRFLPRMDVVRQLLDDGAVGEIETVTADHGQYMRPDAASRLYAPELAGGALLDLGVYPVSFASFVLGPPGRVTARGTRAFTGVDRQVSMILDEFATAPHAHALLTTTLAARTPTAAVIAGSDARIELDGSAYAPGPVRLVTRDGSTSESDSPAIQGSDGLCYQAAHLATLLAEGIPESPVLPARETVAVMETLDRVRSEVGVAYPGE